MGPIYVQVIFKNTAPLRDRQLADLGGLTPSYTRDAHWAGTAMGPVARLVQQGRQSRHQGKRAADTPACVSELQVQ